MVIKRIFKRIFKVFFHKTLNTKERKEKYEETLNTKECQNTNIKEYQKKYDEKLNTKEWREKRAYLLDKYNHKCYWCGASNCLQVHHKYYLKYPNNNYVEPFDYPDNAFLVLCKECHERWHKTHKNKVYYRKFNFKNY